MGNIGSKSKLVPKYTYGEAEEVKNRDQVGFQPRATSFKQISPTDRGGNLNVPNTNVVKSGKFKFNPPV